MKILPAGTEFRAEGWTDGQMDRWTDMTKLINVPKIVTTRNWKS